MTQAGFNLWDFMPAGTLEKYKAEKERATASLQENCLFLGLDAAEMAGEALEVARAAEIKKDCEACPFTIENFQQCKHTSCTLPANRRKDYFPLCEKYRLHEKEIAYRAALKGILGNSGLGKRFLQRRFDTFKATAKTQGVYKACMLFCDSFASDSKGIILRGPYGCGKTHLAAAILHRLAEKGIAGLFVVVPELLEAIRSGFNQQNDKATASIEQLKEAPLLVLDDLGAEKMTDWAREQIFIIINRRYENMLPTVITTNYNTAELVERLGQRTVSRLAEMTTAYTIEAGDYRLKC